MWTKTDSKNLESIAKSLEKLAEREVLRYNEEGIFSRFAKAPILKDEIIVHEPSLEETFEEEEKDVNQKINNKLADATRNNRMPFFPEDLLDGDELESIL
jgi:hypothetical protein